MFDSCEDALAVLAQRMDARSSDIATARDYANGRAPLPEMGPSLKASWQAFQKKARGDMGGLAVGSLANRIAPLDVQIGDGSSAALPVARRIWRDNRLDIAVPEAIRDYLETSYGYLVVGKDDVTGRAVVTREMPEQFIAATDPLRPWRARAALKVWRDPDLARDFANVWIEGQFQRFSRDSKTASGVLWTKAATQVPYVGTGWQPMDEPSELDDGVPVTVLERPTPFLAPHYDVIDRMNLGRLQRLVTTAMQAFRQRAIKGGLPERDAEGNVIDYSKVFDPAPGALWDLPDGIDIWESQTADIRQMLDAEKADAREFAALTGTPLPDILPDSANQSAEGAATAKEKQVFQASTEIKRLSPSLAVMLVYALRVEGVDLAGETVEVLWSPPEHVSMSEKYAAAAQARAAGLPARHIMRAILGMSEDTIAQAMADIAIEQARAVQASAEQSASSAA